MSFFLLCLLAPLALAQDDAPAPSPGEPPPVTEPAERPAPPTAERPPPAERRGPPPHTNPAPPLHQRPLAVPAGGPPPVDVARLHALRAYKSQRLLVREEAELRGGSAFAFGSGGYMRGPGFGYGVSGPVLVEAPTVFRTWGVYQGSERLSVPQFLAASGETEKKQQMQGTLNTLNRRGKVWSAVAVVGAAGLVAGIAGMGLAENRHDYGTWNRVTLGSSGGLALGLVGGSFPRGKTHALVRYPSASMTGTEAQTLVDRHNDALREELGLSPADVWALESQ